MTAFTPLVSVVIPTYNSAKFLAIAIQSVLDQSLADLELVISDHGSCDTTLDVIAQFEGDARVHFSEVPRSSNPVDNWIAATGRARGTYLKLLCADDYLTTHCLEQQVAAMRKHDAALVASRRNVIDERGRTLVSNWGLPGMTGRLSGPRALRQAVRLGTNPFGEPACVLMKREVFLEAGGWDPQQQFVVDLEAYSRILGLGDFVGLPDAMAAFRVSRGQWSIELAGQQRRQMVKFLRTTRQRNPSVVHRWDVALGQVTAAALSGARRLVYLKTGLFGRRRRSSTVTPASRQVEVVRVTASSEPTTRGNQRVAMASDFE